MAPKKHSSFMMFVNKFRTKPEGQRMNMSQAVHHCGEIWKTMTAQERGPYISNAKNKNIQHPPSYGPLNCHGNLISAMEKEEQSLANENVEMKRDIERMVLKGKNAHDLENAKFVFVSFNYFVKSMNSDIYIPAEFSACEFSLKGGVNSLYSSMINPGQLIFGQACDAMFHSNTTHQLPLPPSALGEPNMGKLYQSIQDYLRSRLDQDIDDLQALKVFTTREQMLEVKSCFRFIESGYKNDNYSDDENNDSYYSCQNANNFLPIIVYDIQYLFYILKRDTLRVAGLQDNNINIFITDAFFLRDFYEYYDGISCRYHDEKDRGKYCTQSKVNRWAYTFADYMCGDLAIMMQPGKHLPPCYKTTNSISNMKCNTPVGSYYSLPTSQSKSTINNLKNEDDDTDSLASSLTTLGTCKTDRSEDQTKKSIKSKKNVTMNHFVTHGNRNIWNLRSFSRTIDELTDEEFSMSSGNHSKKNVCSYGQKKSLKNI